VISTILQDFSTNFKGISGEPPLQHSGVAI